MEDSIIDKMKKEIEKAVAEVKVAFVYDQLSKNYFKTIKEMFEFAAKQANRINLDPGVIVYSKDIPDGYSFKVQFTLDDRPIDILGFVDNKLIYKFRQ